MKKAIALCLFALLLIAAFITNPDEAAHRKAMQEKLMTYADERLESKGLPAQGLIAVLSTGVKAALEPQIKLIVSRLITSDNYYLCSVTVLEANGERHVVGVGLFGKVFITDRVNDELDKRLGLSH